MDTGNEYGRFARSQATHSLQQGFQQSVTGDVHVYEPLRRRDLNAHRVGPEQHLIDAVLRAEFFVCRQALRRELNGGVEHRFGTHACKAKADVLRLLPDPTGTCQHHQRESGHQPQHQHQRGARICTPARHRALASANTRGGQSPRSSPISSLMREGNSFRVESQLRDHSAVRPSW